MTDKKPCPVCKALCKSEIVHWDSVVYDEKLTRHVTPEEKIRDEKAKAWDRVLRKSMDEDYEQDFTVRGFIYKQAEEIDQLKKEHGV